MATYKKGNGGHLTPQNNNIQTFPPCRPDDYLANQNKIPANVCHMFKEKNKAYLAHQDMHNSMRYMEGQIDFKPGCHRIIERWKDQYARAGQSTFKKSPDGIVGG